MAAADVVINVPLEEYGSLDWRRSSDLIREGYEAAEAMREKLLPLAVSEDEYERWEAQRQKVRRTSLPMPSFFEVEGFATDDARRLNVLLPRHVGVPLVIEELERDLAQMTGLDRYETITWQLTRNEAGTSGLLVRARTKPFAPPFMMLGLNLENTTSSDFRITVTGRYLDYDVLLSGSELRIDGTLGSNPGLGVEFYKSIGSTPLFVAPYAGIINSTFNLIVDDELVARYDQRFDRAGVNVGVNIGTISDLRVGVFVGRMTADVAVGDPGWPALSGGEHAAEVAWRFDSQDSPVVPSSGTLAAVRLFHVFDRPNVVVDGETIALDDSITQWSGTANRFWSLGDLNRVFLFGAFGTTFHRTALPPSQFTLGSPLRLGAYRQGEILGSHYYIATGGYFRQVGRLPDFMGGPIFAGVSIENGDAFADWTDAVWRTNLGLNVVMDTLIGPVLVAGSAGFDGRWRTYIGIGRLFR
jgi:NTE family protein